MKISARSDYAVRAMAELAANTSGQPVNAQTLAASQGIPRNFLDNILGELRTAGLVRIVRGADGGSMLGRPANDITLAEVLRAVDGPLAAVRGVRPENLEYPGAAIRLPDVWIAVRANIRAVLENVTLADLARHDLPRSVAHITNNRDVWLPH